MAMSIIMILFISLFCYLCTGNKPFDIYSIIFLFFICSFALFMNKCHYQDVLHSAMFLVEENENILYKHTGIIITNKKIITFNGKTGEISQIFIKDIVEIIPYNILGILPFGLKFINNNKTDTFISFDRAKLIEILKTLIP